MNVSFLEFDHNGLFRSQRWLYSHFACWLQKPAVSVSLIVSLAMLLRVFHLGAKSLWLDEALLYWFANGDLKHVLEQNAAYNSAPPLFAVLLHVVMRIETSEAALRAVSCVAGILSIPAIYLLAREFVSGAWAGFAALLAAVAPTQIEYSQQVREYSLTFLLASLMLLAFSRFLQRRTWGATFLLSAFVSVSLFTQYGLALLFFAINLVFAAVLFRIDQRKRAVIQWLVVVAVAAISAIAVYHLSLKHHWVPGGRAAYYLADAYWNGKPRSLVRMAILNTETIFNFAFPTPLVILASALGIVEIAQRHARRTALWLLAVPLAVTFAMSILRAYPYAGVRQAIFLTPMIYVFAALGMAFLSRHRANQAVIAILAVLLVGYGLKNTALYYLSARPQNIRPIVDRVLSSVSQGDRIYVHSGAGPAFSYYLQGHARSVIWGENSREEPEKFRRQLDAVLADQSKLYLVFSHIEADEMQNILTHVSSLRRLELVQQEEGAWLYVAR